MLALETEDEPPTRHGACSCTVNHSVFLPGAMYVGAVYTEHTNLRQGHATALFEALTEWADRNAVTLQLGVAPFSSHALTFEQTKDFYTKHGFVSEAGTVRMIRVPRSVKC